jgi:hypothetical protein
MNLVWTEHLLTASLYHNCRHYSHRDNGYCYCQGFPSLGGLKPSDRCSGTKN